MKPESGSRQTSQPEVAPVVLPSIPAPTPMRAIQIARADLPNLTAMKKALDEKKPYWCVALPNQAYQNFHFGGQSFPAFEEDIQTDENGITQRFRRAGVVNWLADWQRDVVIAKIKNKIMRGRGTGSKEQNLDDTDYSPHAMDHPVGEYVAMMMVHADFQTPPYKRGETPRGAVPIVAPIREAVSA